jgi:hypothetical protein
LQKSIWKRVRKRRGPGKAGDVQTGTTAIGSHIRSIHRVTGSQPGIFNSVVDYSENGRFGWGITAANQRAADKELPKIVNRLEEIEAGTLRLVTALERGQIAVAAISYVYAQPLLDKGWPALIELSKMGFRYPPACVASTRAYVKSNPAVIEAFLKSYIEGIQRVKTDPKTAEDVYVKFARESNRDLVRKPVRVGGITRARHEY